MRSKALRLRTKPTRQREMRRAGLLESFLFLFAPRPAASLTNVNRFNNPKFSPEFTARCDLSRRDYTTKKIAFAAI
jgi:hypothetical protein